MMCSFEKTYEASTNKLENVMTEALQTKESKSVFPSGFP